MKQGFRRTAALLVACAFAACLVIGGKAGFFRLSALFRKPDASARACERLKAVLDSLEEKTPVSRELTRGMDMSAWKHGAEPEYDYALEYASFLSGFASEPRGGVRLFSVSDRAEHIPAGHASSRETASERYRYQGKIAARADESD
ncbi:hypothetical protein HZA56_05120 [Candidatus Poribacteria bacterium]|nr:hypothetical protein [Candidatus Poribacteria bacterium]